MLAIKESKDIKELGRIIQPIAAGVIVTAFKTTDDLRAKASGTDFIAQVCKNSGIDHVETEPDQNLALEKALQSKERLILITGSFFLLSQLRAGHPELRTSNSQ